MKSLLSVLSLFLALAVSAGEQPSFSPVLRNEILNISYSDRPSARSEAGNATTRYYPLIIKLKDSESELPQYVSVLHRRGNLLLAYIPVDKISELSGLGSIARIEGGAMSCPNMDLARNFCGYPEIASGSSFPMIYTGKDVVTGLVDTGIDANHVAFRDPSTGESRIGRFAYFGPTPEDVLVMDSAAEIAEWSTDSDSKWHGTHVAGIMSGGFTGNPYYGIAREADVVAATSYELYSPLLLAGMEEIIDYAKAVEKPAVINMSIGSNTGPHDGTSLFSQYIDLLSRDAILCLSAGNEGYLEFRQTGSFPSDGASAPLGCISRSSWIADRVVGQIDIWSRDSRPVGLNVILQSPQTYGIVGRVPVQLNSAGLPGEFVVATSQEILDDLGNPPGTVSPELAEVVSGFIAVSAEINPDNDRFNAAVSFNVTAHHGPDGKPQVLIQPGIEAVGHKGQVLDFFLSESILPSAVSPRPAGFRLTTDGSISDLCSGENVICVGAMASRPSVTMLDGSTMSVDDPIGGIAYFSSYSSGDGMRVMPDIVAPGEHTVSAISTPFLTARPDYKGSCFYSQEVDGTPYYWASDRGTSMSSPFVAGVIALWLQADPSLTTDDVKRILGETALTPTIDPSSPRWGKGILNASDGLRRVLDGAGVPSVSVSDPLAPVILPNGPGELLVASPAAATLEVFSLSGAMLHSVPVQASTTPVAVPLPSVPSGLHIIRLSSPSFPPFTLKLPLQ